MKYSNSSATLSWTISSPNLKRKYVTFDSRHKLCLTHDQFSSKQAADCSSMLSNSVEALTGSTTDDFLRKRLAKRNFLDEHREVFSFEKIILNHLTLILLFFF